MNLKYTKQLFAAGVIALLFSAYSTSSQISLTQSRYGNGIGLSLDRGPSKAEHAAAMHKAAIIRDRAQHKKFMQSISLEKKALYAQENLVSNLQEIPSTVEVIEATASNVVFDKTEAVDLVLSSNEKAVVAAISEETPQMSAKELKKVAKKKSFVKKAKSLINSQSDDDTLLLVVLAFIIPPLAVYLYEDGWTKRVTVN